MTAQFQATGVVLSIDPLVTLTADLVKHELILTFALVDSDGPYSRRTVRIGGQKLLDLIRFAQLAHGPMAYQVQCWRCDRYFEHTAKNNIGTCSVCLHLSHCAECSQYLHA